MVKWKKKERDTFIDWVSKQSFGHVVILFIDQTLVCVGPFHNHVNTGGFFL